jgi:hypothetical protein
MRFKKKRYYKDEADLLNIILELKLSACPHCGCRGTLILHGFLYGYSDELSSSKVVTGRRIICNNRRKNNSGCGKTLSILKSTKVKTFTFTASALWTFFFDIFIFGKKKAFNKFGKKFSVSSCYRLFNRLKLCQSRIRSLLTREKPDLKIPISMMQEVTLSVKED